MTHARFDAPASKTPARRGGQGRHRNVAPDEFHADIADLTNEQHQNIPGLVQADDFNAELIVRFLQDNGIDARVDDSGAGFWFRANDAARESHVVFACVCLRASISYALEAAFWCIKAKR
ncbi:MAG TPA: hypothetical protein VGC72_19295 [Candidatus Elarobacter sp.]|jgi:hypothetical protein